MTITTFGCLGTPVTIENWPSRGANEQPILQYFSNVTEGAELGVWQDFERTSVPAAIASLAPLVPCHYYDLILLFSSGQD